MGGSILLYFGNFAHHKIFFPIADFVKSKTHQKINATTKYDTSTIAKYGSEAIATIMFLFYVYFGAYILAEYGFKFEYIKYSIGSMNDGPGRVSHPLGKEPTIPYLVAFE